MQPVLELFPNDRETERDEQILGRLAYLVEVLVLMTEQFLFVAVEIPFVKKLLVAEDVGSEFLTDAVVENPVDLGFLQGFS